MLRPVNCCSRCGDEPTCPVCFGHQPCEAATHFGSGKVIVLKRLYCRSNERLLNIPDVLNFTHISPLDCSLKPYEAKASQYWNLVENYKQLETEEMVCLSADYSQICMSFQ